MILDNMIQDNMKLEQYDAMQHDTESICCWGNMILEQKGKDCKLYIFQIISILKMSHQQCCNCNQRITKKPVRLLGEKAFWNLFMSFIGNRNSSRFTKNDLICQKCHAKVFSYDSSILTISNEIY